MSIVIGLADGEHITLASDTSVFDSTKELYKGPKIYRPDKIENFSEYLNGEKILNIFEVSAVFGSVGDLIDSQRIKRILNSDFLKSIKYSMESEEIGDMLSEYIETEIGSKLGKGWALMAGIKTTNAKAGTKTHLMTMSYDYSVIYHTEVAAIGNPEDFFLGYIHALKDNNLEIDLVNVIESNAKRNLYVGYHPAVEIRI